MYLSAVVFGLFFSFGLEIDNLLAQNTSTPILANDTISVLLRLNCTKYVESITTVNLKSTIQDREVTIFAPTNEAFDKLKEESKTELSYNLNTLYFVVLNHVIVDRIVTAPEFKDNTEIYVGLSGTAHVDVKRSKRSKDIWIRGRKIIKRNVPTDLGVIHLVDGVMFPPSYYKPAQLLQNMGTFSIVAQLLIDTGLTFPQSRYTLLAPSDEAFKRLPDFQLELIKRDNKTKLEMLYNLIIPKQIFSNPISKIPGIYFTVNRRIIVINSDKEDIYIQQPSDRFGVIKNKIRIISKDIELGTGLIHAIDGVVHPPPQYTLLELMKEFGMTLFAETVEKEQAGKSLQGTFPRFTIFVPTNKAMKNLPRNIRSKLDNDAEYRRRVILFHMYRGIHLMQNVGSHRVMLSELDERALIFKHNKGKSINIMQSTILHQDLSASNGIINIIDEVLIPHKLSLVQTLSQQMYPIISVFSTALQSLNIMPRLKKSRYIIFAPSDNAFDRLPSGSFPYLLKNPEILRKILLHHIIPGYIHAEVLSTRWVYSFRTLFNNTRLKVHRRGNKPSDFHVLDSQSRYVKARGISLDNPCSNGIINIIDRLVIPKGINILPPSKNSIPTISPWNNSDGNKPTIEENSSTEKS